MPAPMSLTSKLPLAAPRRPAMRAGNSQVALAGGFLLLLAIAACTVWLLIDNRQYIDGVNRTLLMRSKAYQLLTFVEDAETGQRGYLLTHNRAYLTPYHTGSVAAPQVVAELTAYADGNMIQHAALARIDALIGRKLAELAATLALADRGDFAGALALVNDDSGNNAMASIREEVGRFEAEEDRVQTAFDGGRRHNRALLAAAMLGGVALIIVLAAATILAGRRATGALLKAQDDLQRTNENLEGLVAERVSELQLANEEIQRFAYIVSHDLRAPLVNVMGFTSELDAARGEITALLREVEATAPQLVTPDRRAAISTDLPEALGFIRASTSKMDRLINAILKLSREGRRVLTPQVLDMRDLVEAQGKSLSQQLTAGQAELVTGDLPQLTSDRLAVEQIFGNLIENAVKYLADGRAGRIEVSGRTRGAYICYDVKDNGRGIEAKDFERVFELFRRSGEQDRPGEGIGLAYVRNLARRLGGNVSVQSEYGVGSTFTVTLPTTFQAKARSSR